MIAVDPGHPTRAEDVTPLIRKQIGVAPTCPGWQQTIRDLLEHQPPP